jgi:hypothetical protein
MLTVYVLDPNIDPGPQLLWSFREEKKTVTATVPQLDLYLADD